MNFNRRQQMQLALLKSGKEISYGDLDAFPLSVEELKNTSETSPWFVSAIKHGQNANLFRIRVDDCDYALKVAKKRSASKHIDGKLSFFNEVQRRCEIQRMKEQNQRALTNVVETIYVSINHGIILSPWIEAVPRRALSDEQLKSILYAVAELEQMGLFGWDYRQDNIIFDQAKAWLFDFGYLYRFEPLNEFNSNGLKEPVFHSIERFETCFYFNHLLRIEKSQGHSAALAAFGREKQIAYNVYLGKLAWLQHHAAIPVVIEFVRELLTAWEKAFSSQGLLEELYVLESYRSLSLDLQQEVDAEQCSSDSIAKANKLIELSKEHYEFLKLNNALMFGDERLSPSKLLRKYQYQKRLAIRFQDTPQAVVTFE